MCLYLRRSRDRGGGSAELCFVRRPGAGVSAYLPHSLQAKHETNIASGIVSRGPARQATGATSGRFVIARGVGPAIDVDDPFFENYWRRLGPGSWVLGRNRFFAQVLRTYRTVFKNFKFTTFLFIF